MKRSTLIQDLAIRYKYLNHAQVERMVELVFKHLGNQLAQGQRIELRSMGSWHVKLENLEKQEILELARKFKLE